MAHLRVPSRAAFESCFDVNCGDDQEPSCSSSVKWDNKPCFQAHVQ